MESSINNNKIALCLLNIEVMIGKEKNEVVKYFFDHFFLNIKQT